MSNVITKASRQWSSRPADERFTSLPEMHQMMETVRRQSRAAVVRLGDLNAQPIDGHEGLVIAGPNGNGYAPTHYAFGQLAHLAGAPAGYLRDLPSELAADCINYGFKVERKDVEAGVLLRQNGDLILRAATGPAYGRIWNSDIVGHLIKRVGDGVTGHWRVPGEFGRRVEVTNANTTLYASDRDMFVFLADEDRRIEMPNRRDGKSGSLARGFFVWNSEVGAGTLGIATFLFDYVCCNRIVWGAEQYKELRVRHTSGAPTRWIGEVLPVVESFAKASEEPIVRAIEDARKHKLDDVSAFLQSRWSRNVSAAMQAVHMQEENRPIETAWDVVTAATAYARELPHQNERVAIEREAGKLLKAA